MTSPRERGANVIAAGTHLGPYLDLDGNAGIGALMAVKIEADTTWRGASTPTKLFETNFLAPNVGRPVYDISLDGQRFLMIKPAVNAESSSARSMIVENWFEELKRRVPTE